MKRLLLPVVVVVVILITFAASLLYFKALGNRQQATQPTTDNSQLTTIHVPEPNESSPQTGVAVPNASHEIAPGSSNKVRTFDIVANADEFSVKKIIVTEGDIVKINLNHKDVAGKNYDIYFPGLGVKQSFKSGQVKFVEFQAPASGEYEFYCGVCKNNEKTRGVLLVVVPK